MKKILSFTFFILFLFPCFVSSRDFPMIGNPIMGTSGSGTGVTDGDKGDITVSGSGLTYTIDSSPALTGDPTVTDATPTVTLQDSDNAAGTAAINANSSGGTNDVILSIGVEDSTGQGTPYIEVDGVSETVDVLKTMILTGSLGATGSRVTKGWFTDLESTNAIVGNLIPLTSSSGTLLKNFNGDTIASFGVGSADSTNSIFAGAFIGNKVNAASGSANSFTLSGTLGIMNGSDTFRGMYLNFINANHTGTSNTIALIDIPAITGDANANFYGLRFGDFTGTTGDSGEVEQAINIGSGFDYGIYSLSPIYSAGVVSSGNFDVVGAAAMSFGSADVTGITFVTDGGTVTVPEGDITLLDATTAASTYQPLITDGSIPDGYVNYDDLDITVKYVEQDVTTDADPYTLTPTTGYHEVRIDVTGHADNVTLVLSETGATDGAIIIIKNVASNTLDMADSAAVQELNSPWTGEINESITLQYQDDRWVEIARSSSTISVATIGEAVKYADADATGTIAWAFDTSTDRVISVPGDANDTLATLAQANAFTAANSFNGVNPDAADGATVGTSALEWSDLYIADGGVIYFGNDQDVTLTHVADTGLTLNKALTVSDVTNDNHIELTNNSGGRAPTASVYEIYPDAGIWKLNQNGTEYSIVLSPLAGQVSFTGPTAARAYVIADQASTVSSFIAGGTTSAADSLAIPITNAYVAKTTGADAEALTLANGKPGQILNISLVVDGGGDGTLTPTTKSGFTTIVFGDAGDNATLEYIDDTVGWIILGTAGVAAPPVISQ